MLYPQQNAIRNTFDLSGFWNFRLDPDEIGESAGWFDGLGVSRQIAVPGSWNEQFQDTRDYLGTGWYTRWFYVPSGWQGQDVFLRVGSANYAAKVWLNGALVGEHQGGHLPFDLEVTDQINWEDENLIAIQVEAELRPDRVPPGNFDREGLGGFLASYPNTAFDFFPYAGLHRPVILYAVPTARIADIAVVTNVIDGEGIVDVTVTEAGREGGVGRVRLVGQNVDADEPLAFQDGQARAAIRVPQARLWRPDDPYLYKLEVILADGARVGDRYQLDIGIRTIAIQGDKLLLNGEPIYLTGFGKHEDFPVHGRGLDVPLIVKDASLLHWIGANSYRTSHYPYAEEAMDVADREGFLIIDEIPAVGLRFDDGEERIQARLDICKQQLRELVARDKNHPSVIAWSVANEPRPASIIKRFTGQETEVNKSVGTAFFSELYDLVHELDTSRPATSAAVMGCPVAWMALSDIVLVNRYWGWYTQSGQIEAGADFLAQELDNLHDQLGKPIVISEFGADSIAGVHSDPPEMWSEEYQLQFLRRYLDIAAERSFVVGVHVWCFADFKTAQSTLRPAGMNRKGVFTRDRRPKMAAHFLRERWKLAESVPTATRISSEQSSPVLPTLEQAFDRLAARLDARNPELDATIKFLVDGQIYRLIFAERSCHLEKGDGEADTTVSMVQADAIKLLTGQLKPTVALMTGKLQITGDMATLLALRDLA